jgi:hypothetical protein
MLLPDVTALSKSADHQQAVSDRIAGSTENRALRKDRRNKVVALPETPYETSASSIHGDDNSPKFAVKPSTDLRLKLAAI